MNQEDPEETLSGYKQSGSWSEIVEHGEMMAAALRRVLEKDEHDGDRSKSTYEDLLEEFEEWRPKMEDKEGELTERTAEQASTSEGAGEKKRKNITDDVADAQDEVIEAVDSAKDFDTEELKENVGDSVKHTGRATDSLVRKAIRTLEEFVYGKIMTVVSPYYFDNSLVNANVTEHMGDTYTLEVNISDDEIYDKVKDEIVKIQERFSDGRIWKLQIEKDTETAEKAEGVPPQEDTATKEKLEQEVES